MQIIFIRSHGSKAYTLKLNRWHAVFGVLMSLILAVTFFFWGASTLMGFLPEVAKVNVLTEGAEKAQLFRDLGALRGRLESLEEALKKIPSDGKPRSALSPSAAPLSRSSLADLSVVLGREGPRQYLERFAARADVVEQRVSGLLLSVADRAVALSYRPRFWPVHGGITSSFGGRVHPIRGEFHQHTGIDFGASVGTPVMTVAEGVVVATYLSGVGLGRSVDIDHGGGYISRYAHLDGIEVAQGQYLKAGQRIARVGSTGMSTGPHLHFEVLLGRVPVDPVAFMRNFLKRDGNEA